MYKIKQNFSHGQVLPQIKDMVEIESYEQKGDIIEINWFYTNTPDDIPCSQTKIITDRFEDWLREYKELDDTFYAYWLLSDTKEQDLAEYLLTLRAA